MTRCEFALAWTEHTTGTRTNRELETTRRVKARTGQDLYREWRQVKEDRYIRNVAELSA